MKNVSGIGESLTQAQKIDKLATHAKALFGENANLLFAINYPNGTKTSLDYVLWYSENCHIKDLTMWSAQLQSTCTNAFNSSVRPPEDKK